MQISHSSYVRMKLNACSKSLLYSLAMLSSSLPLGSGRVFLFCGFGYRP